MGRKSVPICFQEENLKVKMLFIVINFERGRVGGLFFDGMIF